MSTNRIPEDELQRKILKVGTVRFATGVFKQKRYEDGSVSEIEHSVQEIIEIGVGDLMQIILEYRKALATALLEKGPKQVIPPDTGLSDYDEGRKDAIDEWRSIIKEYL